MGASKKSTSRGGGGGGGGGLLIKRFWGQPSSFILTSEGDLPTRTPTRDPAVARLRDFFYFFLPGRNELKGSLSKKRVHCQVSQIQYLLTNVPAFFFFLDKNHCVKFFFFSVLEDFGVTSWYSVVLHDTVR